MPNARPIAPAEARAAQLDNSVRLENATGQAGTPANLTAASSVTASLSASPTGASNAEPAAQNLPASAPALDESRFAGRVLRGLTAMVNSRGGTMTMRLDPPEMGQLRVQMTVARGVLSAEFQASTPQAHALLEKNLAVLRAALESQGLTVERLNVNLKSTASQQPLAMHEDAAEQDDQQQRQDAAGGESRGRHGHRDGDEKSSSGSADAGTGGLSEFAGLVERIAENADLEGAAP